MIKDIIKQLEKVKTLDEATLEEIGAELARTSDCVLIDRDEIKNFQQSLELWRGVIQYPLNIGAGGPGKDEDLVLKCSFKRFVANSVKAAWTIGDEAPEEFVKSARRLALLLARAANKMEAEIKEQENNL